MHRIRDRFPQKGTMSFYFAYAQSIITYRFVHYGYIFRIRIEPIDKTQRRTFREIFYRRKWDNFHTKDDFFYCLRNVHRRSGERGFQTITIRVT